MQRTIRGFRYDTDKATPVGEVIHDQIGNPTYWRATMYMTPSGKYFLAGYGGLLTRWGTHKNGVGIITLTRIDALILYKYFKTGEIS